MMLERTSSGLLQHMQENKDRLTRCPDHDFTPICPGRLGTLYVCLRCRGEVDGLSAKWYRIGRDHQIALNPPEGKKDSDFGNH
jgi:hypothetical protein